MYDTLCDFAPFVKFKKREKHPWGWGGGWGGWGATFSKVAGWIATLFHGCFSCFLHCTNEI